jgi:hypothetical protein
MCVQGSFLRSSNACDAATVGKRSVVEAISCDGKLGLVCD